MSVSDPYKVLNISPNATDEEVKLPIGKWRVNIIRIIMPIIPSPIWLRRRCRRSMRLTTLSSGCARAAPEQGPEAMGGHTGGSHYGDIRHLISTGRIQDAEVLLDGVPPPRGTPSGFS